MIFLVSILNSTNQTVFNMNNQSICAAYRNKTVMTKQELLTALNNVLNTISQDEKTFYSANLSTLAESVNQDIETREDLKSIIGENPIQRLRDQHVNHAHFMTTAMKMVDPEQIYDHVIGLYNAYTKKDITFDYFLLTLTAWKKSITLISQNKLSNIIQLYQLLIDNHGYFIQVTTDNFHLGNKINSDPEYDNVLDEFIAALLQPSLKTAENIAKKFISDGGNISDFWLKIITPALYKIGDLWENSKITVGEEHTATSLCQMVMSSYYSEVIKHVENKPTIVAITSPNELHQVGLRMLADTLELSGYPVEFLPPNSTVEQIVETIEEEEAVMLIISTTLKGNLEATKEIITKIRHHNNNKTLIIVGGQAYYGNETLRDYVNADYLVSTVDEITKIIEAI